MHLLQRSWDEAWACWGTIQYILYDGQRQWKESDRIMGELQMPGE